MLWYTSTFFSLLWHFEEKNKDYWEQECFQSSLTFFQVRHKQWGAKNSLYKKENATLYRNMLQCLLCDCSIDLLQAVNVNRGGNKGNITKQSMALTDVTWQRANFNKEKTCVTPQSMSIQTCTLRIAFWLGLKKVVRKWRNHSEEQKQSQMASTATFKSKKSSVICQ